MHQAFRILLAVRKATRLQMLQDAVQACGGIVPYFSLGDILGRMYTSVSAGCRLHAKLAEEHSYISQNVLLHRLPRHLHRVRTVGGLHFADTHIHSLSSSVLNGHGTSLGHTESPDATADRDQTNREDADAKAITRAFRSLSKCGGDLSTSGDFLEDLYYRVSEEDVSWVEIRTSMRGKRLGFQMRFRRIPGFSFEQRQCPWVFVPYLESGLDPLEARW